MPRATRRALEEDAPSRSSPRASTRASTAAAASPSKRKGKAEEAESPVEVETKSRGRSRSRAKAATVTPPTPKAGRQSRSRGRSAASEAKTTPKRGRGKPKKQEEEEEEEEEEEVEEEEEEEEKDAEEEEEEEEEDKPKRGRSAGRKTKAAKTTPPARAGRGSRRSAEVTPSEEEKEGEDAEPKKTTGRRSKGRATPTTTPQSRSRRGRKGAAGEPGEQEESEEKAEEERKAEDGSGEAKQEEGEGDSQMKKKPFSAAKTNLDKEAEAAEEKEAEQMDTAAEGDVAKPAESVPAVPEAEQKTEAAAATPAEEKTTPAEADDKMETEAAAKETSGAAEQKTDTPPEEKPEEKEAEAAQEADSKAEAKTAAEDAGKAAKDEEETQKTEEAAPAAEEAMEAETPAPAAPQPDAKNGDDSGSPRKPAGKRKREEDDEDCVAAVEETQAKRVRINGTDMDNSASGQASAADPDVEMTESKPTAQEEESTLLKDYEVVSKDDFPAPDSAEVAAAIPAPKEERRSAGVANNAEEKMEQGGSGKPITVVPLTEAELTKAYGRQLQGMERSDDMSSVIVEVGSVAGSDVAGGLSRGLDVSELQSAANSVDGADSTMNDSSTAAPDVPDDLKPLAPQLQACVQPEPSPLPTAGPASDTVTNGSGAGSVVDQAPTSADPSQKDTSTQQATSSGPDAAASFQNSHPTPPLAKGSGSVTDVLGKPDPAFLAAYSSPGIMNRVFAPNPAMPSYTVSSPNSFSVVSYNILAECHRRRSEYKSPVEFLGQEFRHSLLMKELLYLNGDVVCLQEVDPDYFNNTLLPAMRTEGYDGLMKCRTKEYFHEGEATFYKSSVFELETSKAVCLTEAAHKEVETGGLSSEVATAIKQYLDRADVVLITRLRCKATGKVLTVGNIHVVWDLKSPDVQCIQAACAVKEVVGMSGSDGAHVVCGDFNAEWSSPVYQLVLDGYLSDSSIHTLQSVQRLPLDDGANKSLVNHLWRAFQHTSSNMKSAYSTVTKSEPEVTAYSHNVKTVDYTFYSASCLAPMGVLKAVDLPVVSVTGGLPTKDFPSDHLSLKTVFTFCK